MTPREHGSSLSRGLGFVLVPLASALLPLVILPTITGTFGLDGWNAIAIGISIGTFASVFVAFGWGLVGPAEVARTSSVSRRQRIFRSSLATRLCATIVAFPAAALAAAVLAPPQFADAAVAMALASASAGLSPVWYCVGSGSPWLAVSFDALPKIAAVLVAVAAIPATSQILVYPLSLLSLSLISFTISGSVFSGGRWLSRDTVADAIAHAAAHWHLVLGKQSSGAYTALSVALVSIASPSSIAAFSGIDRFRNIGAAGLAALSNMFQGWIHAGGSSRRRARTRLAYSAMVSAGALGGVTLALGAYYFGPVLFSGLVTFELGTASLLVPLAVVASLSLSHTLFTIIPTGQSRPTSLAMLMASAVGAIGLLTVPRVAGVMGAVLVVLAAEIVFGVLQAMLFRRDTKGHNLPPPNRPPLA